MKAGYIENHGSVENIKIGDVDNPRIGNLDVIIKTKFAALNRLDLFVVQGWPGLNLKMPHILGSDGSGIITEIGPDVITDLHVGDRVLINPGIGCGQCSQCLSGRQNFCAKFSILGENKNGTYAEYVKVPSRNVLKIPDSYPFDKAAAAPLTFLTAWRMLVTQAQIKRGENVLIQGGSGGVSTAAIQISKYFDATTIVTTSSDEKAAKAKKIGADYVINYSQNPNYAKVVFKELTQKKGIDLAVDSVGTATFNTSLKMLRPGGRLVTCGATTGPKAELDIRAIFWKQLKIFGSTMSNNQEFQDVMKLVLNGKFSPAIDKVFKLEELQDAERYLGESNHFGKVLIQI
nr:zinc-binding dehydrogenase [Candidatus Prometheoarchaeum syntrophicum]QEE16147.1 Acryloyl-coenzyme A reductase [Candidatus Prometheoarchaeum syntrophicum]